MSKIKLKDLGTFKNGLNYSAANMQQGYKIIGVSDFQNHYIANLENLEEVEAKIVSPDYLLKNGDILFVRSNGNKNLIGRTMLVDKVKDPITFSGFCIRFRPDKEKVNPCYILYMLKAPYIRKFFSCTQQTNINNLNQQVLGTIEITLPKLTEQENIANILNALTRKIDCNNKINAELEQMAKTIYDYWFVQFDFPNEEGKPYKSSGGKMTYNNELKREIPEGWEVKSLFDIADFTNGLAMQKFRPTSGDSLPVIKIREMSEGITENTERARYDLPATAIISNGDILFSWSATLTVKIWTQGIGALNQHIFKVTSKKYPKSFVYFTLLGYLEHFKMIADKRKTTMGHITQEHLKQSRVCIPPHNIITSLDYKLDIILKKYVLLQQQNQELAKLRDWLLPMLMSGQVTVE